MQQRQWYRNIVVEKLQRAPRKSNEVRRVGASELDIPVAGGKALSHNLQKIMATAFLLILSSCSKDHTYVNIQNSDPNLSYQTGQSWNREKLLQVSNLPYQILNMNRAYHGDVGVGVYLGDFGGKHIAMTVAHLYPDLKSCKDEVSFLIQDQDKYHYYPCDGWNFILAENDIMFFEISNQSADISLLSPVIISKNQSIKNQQLKLISFDRNFADQTVDLVSDSSQECVVLSSASKHIADPDISDDRMITSWSVAVGCDAKHGDSGAPIYNQNLELMGLLWTGKYPKNHLSHSLIPLSETHLWEDYNYFVPIEKIKEELEKMITSPQVKVSDQQILSHIFNSF